VWDSVWYSVWRSTQNSVRKSVDIGLTEPILRERRRR
jgi:hypothetical protein